MYVVDIKEDKRIGPSHNQRLLNPGWNQAETEKLRDFIDHAINEIN